MLKKTMAQAEVEAELGDLYPGNYGILHALAGGEAGTIPPFRVPGADNGGDVFFDHIGMYTRFGNMTTISQAQFLSTIRRVMREQNVSDLKLTVPWTSSGGTRVLRIHSGGLSGQGPLDIFLR